VTSATVRSMSEWPRLSGRGRFMSAREPSLTETLHRFRTLAPRSGIEHELVREALYMTGVRGGVEITTPADIPSAGSGLGSSSAVTVGLLHRCDRSLPGNWLRGPALSRSTAAASRSASRTSTRPPMAGFCDLRFGPDDRVEVDQITLSPQLRRLMSNELLLFYTGITRTANTIPNEPSANTVDRLPQLAELRDLAGEAADGLRSGDVDAVGVAMNKSWEARRALASGISNAQIDQADEDALAGGATGAKVTGAGSRGFLRVVCPLERQRAVCDALSEMAELPITIDPFGSQVVFNVQGDISPG
jgi:D-glycero-alpha-D-manno-heptose-7-phosphate kinase